MNRSIRHKQNHHHHHHHEKEDKLSNLPDCILLHILSFLDTKPAIQTLILSKRWKNVWKYLSNLTFISSNFTKVNSFTEFVSRVFSLRDPSTSLVTLHFDSSEIVIKPPLLKTMINHAVSHNVQQLHISVFCDIQYLPSRLFSCQTLTSLNLSVYPHGLYAMRTVFPNSPDLPALISLSLRAFTFCVGEDGCVEPFSTLSKLEKLILNKCEILSAHHKPNLCISNTTLVNLTIIMPVCLHNDPNFRIELSTPSLRTFGFRGVPIQKLCGSNSNLSNIKHVNIDVETLWLDTKDTPLVLLQWLVELADIKSLTVTLSTLKVLSLVPGLLKIEFTSLCNLKSLRLRVEMDQCSSIPDGIVDFLIQNSRSTKVDIIKLRS